MIGLFIAAALAAESPGYSQGPFNLVIRWGNSQPVVVRYESRARCELAGVTILAEGDPIVARDGHLIEPQPQVSGPNRPYAFCIPS